MPVPFCIPTSSVWAIHLSTSLPSFGVVTAFHFSRCYRYAVLSHHGFNLHFPDGLPRWLSGKESASQWRKTQETWVRFLGQEDPLEEEMATHYSILAWEITWTEEPPGLKSMGSQRVRYSWATEHAWWQVTFIFVNLFAISILQWNISSCLSLFSTWIPFFFKLLNFKSSIDNSRIDTCYKTLKLDG